MSLNLTALPRTLLPKTLRVGCQWKCLMLGIGHKIMEWHQWKTREAVGVAGPSPQLGVSNPTTSSNTRQPSSSQSSSWLTVQETLTITDVQEDSLLMPLSISSTRTELLLKPPMSTLTWTEHASSQEHSLQLLESLEELSMLQLEMKMNWRTPCTLLVLLPLLSKSLELSMRIQLESILTKDAEQLQVKWTTLFLQLDMEMRMALTIGL